MNSGYVEKWHSINYLPSKINILIPISLIFIFFIDMVTPLGFAIWILYCIPLILTTNMKWEKGPVTIGGLIILLTWIAYFFSPEGIFTLFAILNRSFFSLIIIILVVLCARIVKVNAIYDTYKIYYYEHRFKLR